MKLLIIHNKYQSNNIGGEDIVYQNELELLQKNLEKKMLYSMISFYISFLIFCLFDAGMFSTENFLNIFA